MFPHSYDREAEFSAFDDFSTVSVGSTLFWQAIKGTGGTLAVESTGGTWLDIPTAASLNDYQLIATQQPILPLAQFKHIKFWCQFKCTEANTNLANLVMGLSSVTTTGFMQNGSAGPPASFTGAVFYKTGGGMSLGFRSSVGSTNTDNPTFATLVSGTTYRLMIDVNLNDPANAVVTPYINGNLQLTTTTGVLAPNKVQQSFAYGTGNLLYAIAGVKAGSGSAETLSLDYIGVTAVR